MSLPSNIKTLPELLKEIGYYTIGIFSGPHLHPSYGFGRGFEQYINCSTPIDGLDKIEKKCFLKNLCFKYEVHAQSLLDVTGNKIVSNFSNWFSNKIDTKPYFAFIHMWDVHYQYIPPYPYNKLHEPNYSGHIKRKEPYISEKTLNYEISQYDGEISWTDSIIGKIIKLVETNGNIDNTIIIITSDHGEAFWEHGFKGHQNSLFDEEIKVPMTIYYPRIFQKGVYPNPTSHIDILPTIMDILNIKFKNQTKKDTHYGILPGISLCSLSKNKINNDRVLLSELSVDSLEKKEKSLRTTEWKYICNIEDINSMVFDLQSDPLENNSELDKPNLNSNIGFEIKMLSSLSCFMDISESLKNYKSYEFKEANLDSGTLAQLKSLGYVK
jgi:arylsulfatase A-like enzyme